MGVLGPAAVASSREQNPRLTLEDPLRTLRLRQDLISSTEMARRTTAFCSVSLFGGVTWYYLALFSRPTELRW